MAHTVILGGLGANSSIALAQLNKSTGQLATSDKWLTVAGPSPAFIAWNRSSCSSAAAAVTNLLIANHAAKHGEAVTAVQLYPPYAKQTGSTWTDDPCHIALHPSGRWAATASYDAGTVGILEVLEDPSPAIELSQMAAPTAAKTGEGIHLPPEHKLGRHTTYPTEVIGSAAHEAKFSPDGTLLYVPCLKSDHIRMFKFNAETGSLTPNNLYTAKSEMPAAAAAAEAPASSTDADVNDINPVMLSPAEAKHSCSSTHLATAAAASNHNMVRLPAGSGPRHIIFHPNLPVAYVLNELSSTIARFDCDLSRGGHLLGDMITDPDRIVSMLPPGVSATMQGGGELAITNDGRFLYASNRGLSDENPQEPPGVSNIVIFEAARSNGALTALTWEDGNGDVNFPRHFSLSPDESNSYLLVANQKSDCVTVFRRDGATGMLSKTCTMPTVQAGVKQPSFAAVLW